MDFKKKIKKIHFIGIGGIGASGAAKILHWQGAQVSGSDLAKSEITDELKKLGIKISISHKAQNLAKDTDLVVYSPAVPENNPERKKAKALRIKQVSYPQLLGLLIKDKFGIVISGTNGKTTTTALTGILLESAGLDPDVIIGGKAEEFNGNARQGAGKYFVAEGCEHQANMLNLDPKILILTNLEADHLDYYKTLENIKKAFAKFVQKSSIKFLVINNDDEALRKIAKFSQAKIITYSVKNKSDFQAKNLQVKKGKQTFEVSGKTFTLKVPGIFNIYNALAVLACASILKIDPKIAQKTFEKFKGTWRRFQILKEKNKILLVSDYAHHPTAVFGTIKAAREFYPQKRILAVFQPHQHSRTKELFNDFVKSFDQADKIILAEIFAVAGREKGKDQDVSSLDLVREIKKRGKNVIYAKDLKETEKLVLKNIQPNDLVLIMGAGDIYTVAEKVASKI